MRLISRSIARRDTKTSNGPGDTDMGIKWNFRKSVRPLSVPAFSASLYIEFPTGDTSQELGSGLTDYWLNSIAQEPITEKTRLNCQFWILVRRQYQHRRTGHQNTRGHVYTGGLSLVHDLNPRLTPGRGGLRRSGGQQKPGQRPTPGSGWRLVPAQQP